MKKFIVFSVIRFSVFFLHFFCLKQKHRVNTNLTQLSEIKRRLVSQQCYSFEMLTYFTCNTIKRYIAYH